MPQHEQKTPEVSADMTWKEISYFFLTLNMKMTLTPMMIKLNAEFETN